MTVLATSRVVLHLSGEHVYPVEPLIEEAAVPLFLERAGLLWGAVLAQGEHLLGPEPVRWRDEMLSETRSELAAAPRPRPRPRAVDAAAPALGEGERSRCETADRGLTSAVTIHR